MAPTIIVFTNNPATPNQTKWINRLRADGYEPFVDAVHKSNTPWIKSNFLYEHRFYSIGSTIDDFNSNDLDHEIVIEPDIAIAFDKDAQVPFEQWDKIFKYVESIAANEGGPADIDLVLPKPCKEKEILPEPILPKQNDFYDLETRLVEDTMFYQVTKPFTDLPYTTLTHNFSEKGHLPFFTSLFICQSWGVCKEDVAFLKKVWDDWMQGEFDLDKLLKERTEECYPSPTKVPEPEPVVYRRTIDQVLQTLQKRREGFKRIKS